jgi:hypothetical protein
MKLHFLRHASPNSPAFIFAVAKVHRRIGRNASSHSSTSIPASGNVHRRILRQVVNSARYRRALLLSTTRKNALDSYQYQDRVDLITDVKDTIFLFLYHETYYVFWLSY